MSRGAPGNRSASREAGSIPPGFAVQHLETWSAASQLLSPSTLARLCGNDLPNQARQAELFLSQVIVATDRDEPMAFVTSKRGAAHVRVAHGLWVDANARCGMAPVTGCSLDDWKKRPSGRCYKLFIIVSQTTPLRRILQTKGYTITLEGPTCCGSKEHSTRNRMEPPEDDH